MPLEVALAVRPPNQTIKRLSLALAFLVVTLGCSHQPNGTTRNAAAEADLNLWWEGTFSDVVQPEKPGTVTPAHSITIKGGRVLQIGKHVQTKEEYDEQQKDLLWEQHRRSIVKGFRVEQDTVIVLTNLTQNSTFDLNPTDKRDAQEMCHELGSFVWGKADRRWGL